MPLRPILYISLGEGATGYDVVCTGLENDAIPDTDALRAVCKHSNELSIYFQRGLRRVAVPPHICYPVGSLGIEAGVDVYRRRRRPVGFVKEVRVLPIRMVKGHDSLRINVLGIAFATSRASEVEGIPKKRTPEVRFAAQRGPVLFVNVGFVFFRLGPVAGPRAPQLVVRGQREGTPGAVFRYRHRLCRPGMVQGVEVGA